MERRPLGKTGEKVSLLGAGGFHLIEIGVADSERILNRYLDAGGNYIETAASYGNSETKIALGVGARRNEYLLASKSELRDRASAMDALETSLRRLKTDHLDIWYMHSVNTVETAEKILGPDGALEAAEQARKEGKVRFIGVTGHGHPMGLLHIVPQYPFDAMMVPINYYDHFNYPDLQSRLIPLALERGMAVVAMKAIADGYLWRSAAMALRYAMSQPVSHVVAGCNSMAMLEEDLRQAEGFIPMSPDEVQHLYETAPEYRHYVCRQCRQCQVATGIHLSRIFELEGWYDRQMWDGVMVNPEDFALRMRLGSWFGQRQLARDTYTHEEVKIDPGADYSDLNRRCAHGIDIDRKLKIAHAKLTGDMELF